VTENSHRKERQAARHSGRSALLLGIAIFGLLWTLQAPLRENYVLNDDEIAMLADSLLLAPGARWQDWFTRGFSHLYDLYPDWPAHGTEFARMRFSRPAFQSTIYLAHFVFGTDWASYQLINSLAIAGMGAVAFQIAQAGLKLRAGLSALAAMLVVLSPPVLQSWLFGLGFNEPLATILVAGTFLAVLARRDCFCLVLLFLALLTKENTLWAPFATAITIMLRPKLDESLGRRAFTAATMLLPLAMWLGLRFAFLGGIGGTYATAGYTPLTDFLKLGFFKLTHLHYLFITYKPRVGALSERGTAVLILDRGMVLLIYTLIFLWALRILREALDRVRYALHERRWPTVDAVFLVTLWAATALAFNFASPVYAERYATSLVVFAWPALVAEVERRGKAIIWVGLAVLCAVSLTRTSYLLFASIAEPVRNDNYKSMDALLGQVPTGTQQIYVLSAGGLHVVNPEYVRLILGVSAEIVRVAEIDWKCRNPSDLVAFDHSSTGGVLSMTIILPTCAQFYFSTSRFNNDIANGRLYRNDAMSYELPEADPTKGLGAIGILWQASVFLGRRMTVHVRPNGPARFIIEHGVPNGIAWFDTP
jgi:hypothetical protein